MRARGWVVGLLSLGALGCAPGALQFDAPGPDGTNARVYAVRAAFLRGDAAAAMARVRDKDAGGGDHLLRLLERGHVALYAGDARAAARALDDAYWMAEGRVTQSLSNGVAALLTSDRALPYVPGTTEMAMLHYFGARAWLQQGNVREATVDIRRLSALLAKVAGSEAALPPALTATLHEVAAAFYAAAGDGADAEVAARLAARARGDSSSERAADDCANCGTVVLLAERGLVSQRGSRSLGIAIADGDLRGLASVRDDAAGMAAVMTAIDRAMQPQWCGWDRRAICGYERRGLAGPLTIIHVAWPELRAPRRNPAPLQLAVGEHLVPLSRGASVSEGVAADFGRGASGRVARAVARSAARMAMADAGGQAFKQARKSDKHKDAWRVAGVAAILASGASTIAERADTRSWALLPEELVVQRLRVPAGAYVVRRGGPDGALLQTVQVRAGGTVLVALREWELSGPAPVVVSDAAPVVAAR
jgi:uncharacterized protein